MKLVIVESPSKAKTIQKYLGNGFKVLASAGHICDLPQKTLGVDVDNNFTPEYVVNVAKKDIIKKLKQALKESDIVYLATDPDREGEAISWHLANTLGIPVDGNNRIEFHEISSKSINSALKSPRKIDMNLVDAQQARRVLDRLVGYKVSPIISKKVKSGLSGGRVQSAVLKMVVDREREIRAFIPEEYWNIATLLVKPKVKAGAFKASLERYNGKTVKVPNGDVAGQIVDALKQSSYTVDKVKKGTSKSRPSAPFTTSTLQQDGSVKLSMSSSMVMQFAQQLYEGIDIGGEHIALVTYIRTDSVRVDPDIQREALGFIKKHYGAQYAPEKPNYYASKGENVQDAHEAIRPISLDVTPESIKDKVANKGLYRLYKLIYERFIASQMTEAEYATLNVSILASAPDNESFGLKVTGKTLLFNGYTVVYDNAQGGEDEDNASNKNTLPDLNEGEVLNLKDVVSEQKFTKPAPRYSEATLIKAMEENSIGRPSTYASILKILGDREYTEREQKALQPTALGEKVTEFMEEHFKDIVDVGFTAEMEEKLDSVENGVQWKKILADFYPAFIKEVIDAAKGDRKPLPHEVSDVVCEKCGAHMVVREGKYGKFLACPNYPNCKNIKNLVDKVATCPACGGSIGKRKSRTGLDFFGCGNYPKCKFMSWELPAPIFCPKCGDTMKIVVEDDKKRYVCVRKTCGNVVAVLDGDKDKTIENG